MPRSEGGEPVVEERSRSDADGKGEDGPKPEDGGPQAKEAGAEGGKQQDGPAATAAANEAVEALERRVPNLRKTGGVYVPPFKLARMMQDLQDQASPEYQRLTWEALKKSINGIVNKINTANIKSLLAEVFRENLVRGRGLFCRSLMKSQLASPSFSPVYSALVAVVNTKFPELGELLLHRLCLQFMRSYKRNDKPVCTAAARFLAHLINQGVAHEVLALEILILMLERPSGDSVEMACEFVKEVGTFLQDVAPQGLHSVFERFRAVLHEGNIEKRSQFVIEGLFAVRKAGFEASGFKSVPPELDLVDADDQITHEMSLDDVLDPQVGLDVFKVDPAYEQHEREYKAISREILGEESEDEEDGEGEEEGAEEEDTEEAEENERKGQEAAAIEDATQTNLVNLRRTIYLTIMSSLDFEEAGHKLMKIGIQPGQEIEMVTMVIECCSQERTYKRFYGLLAQRFCYINRIYMGHFDQCFRDQYAVIHRLETNKLRNVAALFAHLLATDALPWSVLNCIRLTEDETTSSSRIFIKYLFQELSSTMGVLKLAERINDPTCQEWYDGIFPKDTQGNLRFAINFFTSIGLGGLTDKMREHYKEMPRIMEERQAAQQALMAKEAARQHALRPPSPSSSDSKDSSSNSSSSSDSDSDSSDSSSSSSSSSSSDSSSSSSDSEDERKRRKKKAGSKDNAKAKAKAKELEMKAAAKEKEHRQVDKKSGSKGGKREDKGRGKEAQENGDGRRNRGGAAEEEQAVLKVEDRQRREEAFADGRCGGGGKRRERGSRADYEDRGGEEKRRRMEDSADRVVREQPRSTRGREEREERGSSRRR